MRKALGVTVDRCVRRHVLWHDYQSLLELWGWNEHEHDFPRLTHTYTLAGTYTVSLIINGPLGANTDTQTNYIAVIVPPVILTAKQSGSSFIFTWSTITNQTYQIQATTNLAPANWTNLVGTITASNSITTNSQTIGTNSQEFYRVVLLP